jgi:hypothetical protein
MDIFGGGGDKKKMKLPKAPKLSEGYERGVNLQLNFLQKQLDAEARARGLTDSQRVAAQQRLQQQFGATQSKQQLEALNRMAPGYMQRYQQAGKLASHLAQTPTQYERLANLSARTPSQFETLAGREAKTVSPFERQALAASRAPSLYENLALRAAKTPSAYEQHALKDLKAGYGLTSGLSQEVANTIRGRQALSGNVMGNAPIAAEAAFTGSAMNEMYQQRMSNAQQAEADRQARLGGAATSEQIREARMAGAGSAEQMRMARMGLAGTAEGIHQARLGGAAQAAQMQQQRLGALSSFLGGANPAQQVQGIAPISPDRSFAYVNPNAGYLGLQAQQNQYANQLGAAGLNQSGQSSGFPWGQLLSTAGTVAAAFSDRRLKKNVSRIGQTPSGLNIYKYQMRHNNARMVGAMADDVEKKQPDAVITDPSGTKMVDYGKVDVPLRRIA